MNNGEFIKIHEQVKEILQNNPKLRSISKRSEFIWEYWIKYSKISQFGLSRNTWLEIYHNANPETISRAIRKVLEENPELRAKDDIGRYEQAELFRELYKKKEVDNSDLTTG